MFLLVQLKVLNLLVQQELAASWWSWGDPGIGIKMQGLPLIKIQLWSVAATCSSLAHVNELAALLQILDVSWPFRKTCHCL